MNEAQFHKIEELFKKIETLFSPSFEVKNHPLYGPYLNHAKRVFLYVLALEPQASEYEEALASVCYFHDLGIFTNQTMDYLEPSNELFKKFHESFETTKDSISLQECMDAIEGHHKISSHTQEKNLPEAMRKADLIDLSYGIFQFGLSKKQIKEIFVHYPSLGFHWGITKAVLGYALKNPLKPFPMLKL